jgi:hypothetical protein
MNTAQTKALAWTAAGLAGAALAGYVVWFGLNYRQVGKYVSTKEMSGVLQNVPAIVQQAEDIVSYDRVRRSLIDMNWTGKAPVKAVVAEPPKPPERSAIPVAKLVKIRAVRVDGEDPSRSLVLLAYLPDARFEPPPRASSTSGPASDTVAKLVGERLDPPNAHVRVFAVRPDAVEFAFDDESRAHETLAINELPLAGRWIATGGSGERPRSALAIPIPIGASSSAPPLKTQEIRPNEYRLGVEDVEYIGQNYAQVLAEEVRYERHRDPKTGRYDGIGVVEVAANSIASQHGLQPGDVVKKINGHPVSSVPEAVNFVKNNQNLYDVWEVEIWNKGQTKTIVYHPPKK